MKACWCATFLLLTASLLSAQDFDDSVSRLIVGGSAGVFRISHDDFKGVYGSRSAFLPSGHALLKIKAPYNLIAKYRRFEKNATATINDMATDLQWQQRFLNLGLRYVAYGERRFTQFFGFGVSLMNIEESGPRSVVTTAGGKRDATGFYLEVGTDYRFMQRAAIFFEVEISSAGVEGKSAFEGTSVGGYYLALGMNLFVL
ncbi:hypothetical protein HUU05_17195 [candidate division KSB1 bacterium]|nr:hypothetical protein [candidate division KSB1 bacterium]